MNFCEARRLPVIIALTLIAVRADASTFTVPQPFTLTGAIAAAADGDTILIAAGTIDRIPPAFSKRITIIGLGTTEAPTILAGLRAGLCRIENITFQPATPLASVDLLQPTDSLTVFNCVFTGVTATGIRLSDAGAASPRNLTVLDSRFNEMSQGAALELSGAVATRVRVERCTFTGGFYGVIVQGPAVACPPPPGEPPTFDESDLPVRVVDCVFDGAAGCGVSARNVAAAFAISGGTLTGCTTGLELLQAGGLVTSATITGAGQLGTGVHARSSRFVIRSSQIRGNDVGVLADTLNGCGPSAGVIGGDQASSCAIAGNTINLSTTAPIQAEYNFWGSYDCETVLSQIVGQTVHFIVDESGFYPVECLVPVEPSTWSDIKTRHRR